MCGRTACTLSKAQLQQCCTYQSADGGQKLQPEWRQVGDSTEYRPGYNMPPSSYLPVLYSDPEDSDRRTRIISTMKWGLVPSWVSEDPASFSLNMSNARVETLTQKASFRNLVNNGRRCALVCEGFYEWRRPHSGPKQPYFFHLRDWAPGANGSQPPSVMCIAGLYDVHRRRGHADLYTFTVVTVPAASSIADIHHRMPAILVSRQQLDCWLHCADPKQAASVLTATDDVNFYPVSPHVNSTQHNDAMCLRPVQPGSGALHTLDKWFADKSPEKKPKQEQRLKQEQKEQQKQQTGITRWVSFKQKRGGSEPTEAAPSKSKRLS